MKEHEPDLIEHDQPSHPESAHSHAGPARQQVAPGPQESKTPENLPRSDGTSAPVLRPSADELLSVSLEMREQARRMGLHASLQRGELVNQAYLKYVRRRRNGTVDEPGHYARVVLRTTAVDLHRDLRARQQHEVSLDEAVAVEDAETRTHRVEQEAVVGLVREILAVIRTRKEGHDQALRIVLALAEPKAEQKRLAAELGIKLPELRRRARNLFRQGAFNASGSWLRMVCEREPGLLTDEHVAVLQLIYHDGRRHRVDRVAPVLAGHHSASEVQALLGEAEARAYTGLGRYFCDELGLVRPMK